MRRILRAEILSVGRAVGIFIDGAQTIQGLSFSSVGQRSLGKGLEVQSIHDHDCMGIKVARIRLVTQRTPV